MADFIQPASPDATASPTSLLAFFFSPKIEKSFRIGATFQPDPGPIAKLQSTAYSFESHSQIFCSLQCTVCSLQLTALSVEQDPSPIAILQSTAYNFAVLRAPPRIFNSLQLQFTPYSSL